MRNEQILYFLLLPFLAACASNPAAENRRKDALKDYVNCVGNFCMKSGEDGKPLETTLLTHRHQCSAARSKFVEAFEASEIMHSVRVGAMSSIDKQNHEFCGAAHIKGKARHCQQLKENLNKRVQDNSSPDITMMLEREYRRECS